MPAWLGYIMRHFLKMKRRRLRKRCERTDKVPHTFCLVVVWLIFIILFYSLIPTSVSLHSYTDILIVTHTYVNTEIT